MQVQSGSSDVVLAGGAESMSNAPFYTHAMRWEVKAGSGVLPADGLARGRVTAGGQNYPSPGGMLETAENLRRDYRINRQEQDEYAVRSHQRAAAATEEGRIADEIVPVTVKQRKGELVVDRDLHIRPDSSVETIAKLRPFMAGTTRRRLSPPATPAGRTTAPRSARSPRRRRGRLGPASAGAACVLGRGPASRRRPWASGRCRPPPRRWRWRWPR